MLNNILKDFEMKISCSKSKTTAFLGQQPVRNKIVIENKILEQVNAFNYLVSITYHMKVKTTSRTKSLNF
jgi:phage major head subunit gpT-like protein